MKLTQLIVSATFVFAASSAFAADPQMPSTSMPSSSDMMNKAGNMAKTELEAVKTAMKDCMATDKTGKSCGEVGMSKCKEKMGDSECTKIVAQAKQQLKIK
jgi:hypothetical protein